MFQKNWIQLDFSVPVLPQILEYLHYLSVQSLIVEGGANTLQRFIDSDLWDEARVITSSQWLGAGLKAPVFTKKPIYTEACGNDAISYFFNFDL
jgi:diaminohydroxyphosphoribosylaminopyrimidine deaminase/5-amino-6-(5-phosphoribosylamino)uracil reductase